MFEDFKKLYQEYEEAILIQEDIIRKNRDRLKAARIANNLKEVKRLNGLLLILYEEKSELEERATQLREYLS
ncbi:MAG: hypothetical protein IJ262_06905 [Clostridia bacterium]|nr:hypothetical protein [Clostridia bacterium]